MMKRKKNFKILEDVADNNYLCKKKKKINRFDLI